MKGRVMYVALLMTALVYRVFYNYSRVSASVASCKEMRCEEFSPRIQSEHMHILNISLLTSFLCALCGLVLQCFACPINQ